MDIKGVTLQSQQFQNKPVNKESLFNADSTVTSSSDKVTISEEAHVMFNQGGGHPERPKKSE